jgi:integrase
MPAYKRKYGSGKTAWYYMFSLPGATRQDRDRVSESGFATKREAEDAEARRRIEEQQKVNLAKAGASVAAALPKTLLMLLEEFFAQHVDQNLAPKTVERYHEQAAYLDPGLLAMALTDITPLHLNREWKRLLACGGRHRRTKTPRPLSKKTVRNIAGVLPSAFARAIKWGLLTVNPVTNSEPPIPAKRKRIALTTAQQDLLINSATGPWCIQTYLTVDAALGARRGEVLALRWQDIENGRVTIARSLSQTKRDGLIFKTTKEENVLVIGLPPSALAALEAHRKLQDEFRAQFGPDYRNDLNLIFANPDGTPLSPDSVSATVSALFKRLNIQKPKGAALHLLRHSHGSHMLANGVPLPVVSQRLGHSSVRTTADIYVHAIHGQDDEVVRKWEEYQERNRPAKPENRKQDVQ